MSLDLLLILVCPTDVLMVILGRVSLCAPWFLANQGVLLSTQSVLGLQRLFPFLTKPFSFYHSTFCSLMLM